jgi:hypothetical protein
MLLIPAGFVITPIALVVQALRDKPVDLERPS